MHYLTAGTADTALWSSPWFWCALPFLVLVIVLGMVAGLAVMRARKEDVPRVLAIFTAAFAHLADRLPADLQQRDDGVSGPAGGAK